MFTLLAIIFLLVIGGLAVDLATLFTARQELQRSMDAAALAGAGKLGFDSTAFPTARQFAVDFAQKNPSRVGTVTLSVNTSNDATAFNAQSGPNGDVVLGIWNPSKPQGVGTGLRFEPSLDGTQVNAVLCRYKTPFQTSLLRLWGMNTLSVGALAIATSDPPVFPPPTGCAFPIGLSMCPFQNNNIFTSSGCGVAVKFTTTNSGADTGNTAAWVSLDPTQGASSSNVDAEVKAASNGTCTPAPAVGTTIKSSNGQLASAFADLETGLVNNFGPATTYTVLNKDGSTAYSGPGWQLYVPVLQTPCNADGSTGSINGPLQVVGWTRFVMTQAWDPSGNNKTKIGQGCVVNNPWDSTSWKYCQMTQQQLPSPLNSGNSRAAWGYYACATWDARPVTTPAPRSSLADKITLRE